MRFPSTQELKKLRLNLGLTQNELARLAGVSQPLIARIEAGDIDPRLSTIKKIFEALESVERESMGQKISAKEIMTSPVMTVEPEDTIEKAVEKMEKHALSQLPVVDLGIPVGSISDGTVLHALSNRDFKKTSATQVRALMDEPFPAVSSTTDLSIISSLLESNHAVLVIEKGKVAGVITKHDVMKLVHK